MKLYNEIFIILGSSSLTKLEEKNSNYFIHSKYFYFFHDFLYKKEVLNNEIDFVKFHKHLNLSYLKPNLYKKIQIWIFFLFQKKYVNLAVFITMPIFFLKK